MTVAHATDAALEERSILEGRSLSNLTAFLLESALESSEPPSGPPGKRA